MSNKVLARALVKTALKKDRQVAINAADSAQVCVCDMQELSPAESKELKEWIELINSDNGDNDANTGL